MTLGADSEVPPSAVGNAQVWGIYVAGGGAGHIWSREEAAALKVPAELPIAVPEQTWPWPKGIAGTCAELVAEARHWGIPHLSPLALDIEENQAEEMGPTNLASVWQHWCLACETPVSCGLPAHIPWGYGSRHSLGLGPAGLRKWLAAWLFPAGEAPANPPAPAVGFAGWQYAGNVPHPGGTRDLDVFADGYRFALPSMAGTVVIGPRAGMV